MKIWKFPKCICVNVFDLGYCRQLARSAEGHFSFHPGYCEPASYKKLQARTLRLAGLCLNKASAVSESLCHWSPLLPRQQVRLSQAVTGFPLSQMKNKKGGDGGESRVRGREGEELTFITRVPWLSLRGLNNQYVKLSGCALAPTTRLQTPGCFLIKQKRWEAAASAKSQAMRWALE